MLFPSTSVAERCLDFLRSNRRIVEKDINQPQLETAPMRSLDLFLDDAVSDQGIVKTSISVVLLPETLNNLASKFWQHTGDGISSRRAEFFQQALIEGRLVPRTDATPSLTNAAVTTKGPRRYRKEASIESQAPNSLIDKNLVPRDRNPSNKDGLGYVQFVEERFGRNLDVSLAGNAKLAIRRRIAGKLRANVDLSEALADAKEAEQHESERGVSENDVLLYPTGMSCIYNTHRTLMRARGPLKSIMFGYARPPRD